ncbi:unnamed protein product (macronuclear) [Paramecium tetraurelia]|uniref:Transmembrane protein n=1 Tax=Paramecium tetraurelia TaxID=5888 RepID=A0BPK9_PARTE|nr:uncharacterized protein GSPATT00005225001 [Paramecium tetraurelia]CAK60476.1 unnamed protein product [Paramecium tetraurelia]|eukprot:XP_001427874.1 hypothetical protein (macronuclear) [Paramecium tetraurelia strain d4-2]
MFKLSQRDMQIQNLRNTQINQTQVRNLLLKNKGHKQLTLMKINLIYLTILIENSWYRFQKQQVTMQVKIQKNYVQQEGKMSELQDKIVQLQEENDKLQRYQLKSQDDFLQITLLKESALIIQLRQEIEIQKLIRNKVRKKVSYNQKQLNQRIN